MKTAMYQPWAGLQDLRDPRENIGIQRIYDPCVSTDGQQLHQVQLWKVPAFWVKLGVQSDIRSVFELLQQVAKMRRGGESNVHEWRRITPSSLGRGEAG